MKRRDFIKTPVMFGAYAMVETRKESHAESNDQWFDRPMRWAQLTLVDNDPGTFDPDFWLDYFRRTRAQGACLSAGGCVAYYPTEVPLHHRSRGRPLVGWDFLCSYLPMSKPSLY